MLRGAPTRRPPASTESCRPPVLILLDEVMDYVLQLSDQAHLGSMPGEQSFIGALMDAVDEVPESPSSSS